MWKRLIQVFSFFILGLIDYENDEVDDEEIENFLKSKGIDTNPETSVSVDDILLGSDLGSASMNASGRDLKKRQSTGLFSKKKSQSEFGMKVSSLKDLKVNTSILMVKKNNSREFGTIRYIGKIEGDKKKDYVGIEWNTEGFGNSDGSVKNTKYFQTKSNTASFIDFKSFQSNCYLL
jgi:hypothetical protein